MAQDEPTLQEQSIPNLSEAIEKLMAHPEILQMAASVMSTPKDDASATKAAASEIPKDPTPPSVPTGGMPDLLQLALPLLSGGKRPHGKSDALSRSTALLIALKPYLSASRCETVDKLVQIGRLGTLFDIPQGGKRGESDVFEKS